MKKLIERPRSLVGLWFLLMLSAGLLVPASAATNINVVPVTLGDSIVTLNGPWRFHTGDAPGWAEPAFDDSRWESVDLTAPPGAHDPDAGLSGYVPGWAARGHAGYTGYAWYRLRFSVTAPAGSALALTGPAMVDDAYQVFLDGKLLGGIGDFSGPTPVAHVTRPHLFPLTLPPATPQSNHVLAFRVWMGAAGLRVVPDTEAGGLHMAPALGDNASIEGRYHLQWMQTFWGYFHEVVEALLLLLTAVMTCCLIPFDRSNRAAYFWLSCAMVLLGLFRGNLAFVFWTPYETVHEFELLSLILFSPLYYGAWTLGWYSWFRLRGPAWVPKAVALLTLLFVFARFLSASWFYGVFPHWVSSGVQYLITFVRLLFLLLLVLIVYKGIREQRREAWFVVPAVLAVSTGLFSPELEVLGFPGMWFPFGVGFSRTDLVYLLFGPLMFPALLRRLWLCTRPTVPRTAEAQVA